VVDADAGVVDALVLPLLSDDDVASLACGGDICCGACASARRGRGAARAAAAAASSPLRKRWPFCVAHTTSTALKTLNAITTMVIKRFLSPIFLVFWGVAQCQGSNDKFF
jgi:hypothetical protein